MTIQRLQRDGSTLRLRFFPILAWFFGVVALYNLLIVVTNVVSGRQALDGGVLLALALIVGFAGFVLFYTGQYVECRFDRGAGTLSVVRVGLGGRSVVERPLADLRAFRIRFLRRTYSRIELLMGSGEVLATTSYYMVLVSPRGVQEIATALGLPIESAIGPDNSPRGGGPPVRR